ncbi:MAG TPA: hypothetical protein VGF94_18480 [Kofleriaceae bacterium]|jgi:hypothetical protein
MDSDVVVWNLDVRRKPELEVELDIEYQAGELPGLHYARRDLALEVAIEVLAVEDIADLTAEAVLFDDDFAPIFDLPPRGYARAYEQAAG